MVCLLAMLFIRNQRLFVELVKEFKMEGWNSRVTSEEEWD